MPQKRDGDHKNGEPWRSLYYAADRSGFSYEVVRRDAKDGTLEAYKYHRRWRTTDSMIDAWLKGAFVVFVVVVVAKLVLVVTAAAGVDVARSALDFIADPVVSICAGDADLPGPKHHHHRGPTATLTAAVAVGRAPPHSRVTVGRLPRGLVLRHGPARPPAGAHDRARGPPGPSRRARARRSRTSSTSPAVTRA